MRFKILVLMTSLSLISCGSVPDAWNSETAVANATSNEVRTSDGKLCKKTRVTGSQMNKVVCLSDEEWEDMAEKSKAGAKALQDASARSIRSTGGGGGI